MDTVEIVDWLEVPFPPLRNLPSFRVKTFFSVFARSVGNVLPRTLLLATGFILGDPTSSASDSELELELEELESSSPFWVSSATAAMAALVGTTFRGPFIDEMTLLKNELNMTCQRLSSEELNDSTAAPQQCTTSVADELLVMPGFAQKLAAKISKTVTKQGIPGRTTLVSG
jgi:hypothetical protein